MHLEDMSSPFSIYGPLDSAPDIFDERILQSFPQLCIDRISIRLNSPTESKLTEFVFSMFLTTTLTLTKLKFLHTLLIKQQDELHIHASRISDISQKLISEFADYCPPSFTTPHECIAYSSFSGLYQFFSDEHNRQLNRLLIEHMIPNDVSMDGIKSIRQPADILAKLFLTRFSKDVGLEKEPIPLFGEISLIGCDKEILEKSSIFIPHIEAYLREMWRRGTKGRSPS